MRQGRGRFLPRAALSAILGFAIAGARGEAAAARRALQAARGAGARRRALEETGLMLVLYAGYPAALEALRELNAVWPGRPRGSPAPGPAACRRRGAALCRRVYGPVYPRLVDAVRALHPDLARWMIDEGYGRVLSRSGLGVCERELITVAVLTATGRERQLLSHLLGARRVGATRAALRQALRLAVAHGAPAATARRAWRDAFAGRVDPVRGTP